MASWTRSICRLWNKYLQSSFCFLGNRSSPCVVLKNPLLLCIWGNKFVIKFFLFLMNDSLSPFPSFTLCHEAINYQFVTSESSAMNVFLVPSSSNPSHAAGWIKVYPDDGRTDRETRRTFPHSFFICCGFDVDPFIHPSAAGPSAAEER